MFLYSLQPCIPSKRTATVKSPASVRVKQAVYVCLPDAFATTAEMQNLYDPGNSMHRALVFCFMAIGNKAHHRSARSDVMTASEAGKIVSWGLCLCWDTGSEDARCRSKVAPCLS